MSKVPPAQSTSPPADPAAEKKALLAFAGGYLGLSLLFLVFSLAGTSSDLLGGASDGSIDWMGYVRQLPPAEADAVPKIYMPVADDPLTWDTRPGGPPQTGLPSESTDALAAAAAAAPEVTEADLEAIEKAKAAAARKAEVAAEVKQILKAGDKLLRTNRYPQAKETYLRAARLDSDTKPVIAEKFFEKGRLNERKRAWSRAQTLYRICLHFQYENPKYHSALAETSQALGKISKAKEHRRLAKKFKDNGR